MKTHRKDNTPTAYGFACGYCITKYIPNGVKQMYKEHNIYQVRIFEYNSVNAPWPFKNRFWDSHEKLKDARKQFISIKSA